MNYTVAEFRKNIREALNAVERGEDVYITRHNKTFAIIKAPFNYLNDDGKSHNIRPDIPKREKWADDQKTVTVKNNSEAKASNTDDFVEAGVDPSGELACCKGVKPCKHWQWDGVEQAYVNTLSGRKKEV